MPRPVLATRMLPRMALPVAAVTVPRTPSPPLLLIRFADPRAVPPMRLPVAPTSIATPA